MDMKTNSTDSTNSTDTKSEVLLTKLTPKQIIVVNSIFSTESITCIRETIRTLEWVVLMHKVAKKYTGDYHASASIRNYPLVAYSNMKSNLNSLYNNGIIRAKTYNLIAEMLFRFNTYNYVNLLATTYHLQSILNKRNGI